MDQGSYSYVMNILAVLQRSSCQIIVKQQLSITENGKINRINQIYQELAEHYGTAIIPARVRSPKDKPNAEGTVGNISTWITAALRNEQFFSLAELNRAIRKNF